MRAKIGYKLRRLATWLDGRGTMDYPADTDVYIRVTPGRQVVTLTKPGLDHVNFHKLGGSPVTYTAEGGVGGGGIS